MPDAKASPKGVPSSIIFSLHIGMFIAFSTNLFGKRGKPRGHPLNPVRGEPLHPLSLTSSLTWHYVSITLEAVIMETNINSCFGRLEAFSHFFEEGVV